MFKIIGSIIIVSVGVYFSRKLCTEQEDKLQITNALIEFVDHIRSSIYTSRLPLSEIFNNYNNEKLSDLGFIYRLRNNGLKDAINTVSKHITERSKLSLETFVCNLGGINAETQLKLCEEISNILRDEHKKQKEHFMEKKKMYRTLPILFAMSIIIMVI